VLVT